MSPFEKVVCCYFSILFVCYLAILVASPVKPEGFTWGLSTLFLPAYELTFLCIGTLTLWKVSWKSVQYFVVLVCILIPAVTGFLYLVQLISIIVSGKYITVLAMENAGELAYVTKPTTIALCLGMACLVAIIVFAAISETRKGLTSRLPSRSVFAGLGLIFLMGFTYSERNSYIDHARSFGIPISLNEDFAPVLGIHSTYTEFSQTRFEEGQISQFLDDVSNGHIVSPFHLKPTADFPFQQTGLHAGSLPFDIQAPKEPINVIVLFLEGLSARAMGHYGGPYDDLMPNLNRFARHAVTIDNYYNHTAATYRGIQGSLSSGFPLAGGAGWESSQDRLAELSSVSYATLPKILNARGYDTRIYSPHTKSKPFDDFLRTIGFAKVITPEDVILDSPTNSLSDRDLFAAMAADLRARDRSRVEIPFFWASYNIGSHAFLDSPVGAAKYNDGRNSALNRFHELDVAVRKFLDAFEASTFVGNTLLIITTDHSSYAEPPVVAAFSDSPKFTTHFIDQIPFILRIPGVSEPTRFQNGVRTSLDLAPTILHLMGVTDAEHAFLGTSIFDAEFEYDVNWGMIWPNLYRIDHTGVSVVAPDVANTQESVVKSAIMYYNQLELENRIFDSRQ
ncbi:LTA synthase family protein [Tateyamaria sp. Alg231-49]|uniref:LTA synthase family protein n=1 Tax=Tateyamaria sp. Alg231-49 TaxID=1922219 RepID=UPI00131F1650|nr:sulfatase-like hydrolase/transferase [Tateyamaria sp. Alg231-49]